MPIKHQEIISRKDFDEAVVRLRLNVSDVAKATEIPRTYLSEFRNGDRRLKPEHQAKLRDFFEARGIEFEADPADVDDSEIRPPVCEEAPLPVPHPRLSAVQAVRCYFPIAETVPDAVVAKVMDLMEENDARLVALFKVNVGREQGLFSAGGFTDDFQVALQEAFALCALNYLLFRMLRGWRAFGVPPTTEDPAILRDVLFDTFKSQLIAAGLIDAESISQDGDEADAETVGEEDAA